MTTERLQVLVPPAVAAPRGALWAGDAAAWLWRALRLPHAKASTWSS